MKRVLVVDDDERFLQALARELLARGYRVDEATDGLEGIEKAMREPPDIAVVDLIMPKVGGAEMVAFFRQNPYLRSTPIVLLTGVLVESGGTVGALDVDCVLAKGPFAETTRLLLGTLERLGDGPRVAKQVITQPGIHERRQVVELLRIKGDLGSVLEGAAAGIIELDMAGRITYANSRAEELLGVVHASLIGSEILSVFPRSGLPSLHTLLSRFDHERAPARRAMVSTIEDRTIRTVLTSIWHDGEPHSIVVTLLELTPDAEAETRPVRLLQYLAHEMRSVLLMIEGQLRAMEARRAEAESDPAPAVQAATISLLAEEAGRLVRMLDDATSFHRTLRELTDIDKEPVDLAAIVNESLAGVSTLAGPQGITLDFDPPRRTPKVWAHHDKLLQVLYNLLLNAVRFTPRGGRVSVEMAVTDGEVATTIADTGRGMTAEQLHEVMAQAQRAELFLPRKSRRVGLGLAIAHQIVRAHRGRLYAESTPGAGSRFTFTLPLAPERPSPPTPLAHGVAGR